MQQISLFSQFTATKTPVQFLLKNDHVPSNELSINWKSQRVKR